MKEGMRTLLLVGGTRSGKSAMAQRWAEAQGPRRLYVATAQVEDAETALRVQEHQAQRGVGWSTVEVQDNLLQTLQCLDVAYDAVLVDCITMWLSTLMLQEADDHAIMQKIAALCGWLRSCPTPLVLVSSEVGQGIVPMSAVARRYRDLHGKANQQLASACASVILVSCGLPLALKGILPEVLCE